MSSNSVLSVERVRVRYKIPDKMGKVPELAGRVPLGMLNFSCLGGTGRIDGSKTRTGETKDSHSPLSKMLRYCPSPHFSHCHSRRGLGWKSGLSTFPEWNPLGTKAGSVASWMEETLSC